MFSIGGDKNFHVHYGFMSIHYRSYASLETAKQMAKDKSEISQTTATVQDKHGYILANFKNGSRQ
jgi:hypothetical protein